MKTRKNIVQIPLRTRILRKLFLVAYNLTFPRGNTVVDKRILARINQAAREGTGLLIIFTHFSYRDPLELYPLLVFTNPELKNREVANPVAFHQYKKPLAVFTGLMHSLQYPVVNQDTIERKGYEHLNKGDGLNRFVDESVKTLSTGGVVTLAVNAGRRERLDLDDKQRPLGYFMLASQGKGLTHYGILLASFSLKDAKSYTKKEVGGVNLGKRYTLTLSQYYDSKELLAQPEVNGKAGNVDLFIRKKFAEVAPKAFLPKNYIQI